MSGESGPNKRGSAERSTERNVRYATHVPALAACIGAMSASADNRIYLVEHGMGLGSTPFFHSVAHVANIVSLEREPDWVFCNDCNSGSTQPHTLTLLHDETAIAQARECIVEPGRTAALVDGYAAQRLPVLEMWMALGVKFIVEHDADTFKRHEVRSRTAIAARYGYQVFQYTQLDPESAIYVSNEAPSLSLTGSCVCV